MNKQVSYLMFGYREYIRVSITEYVVLPITIIDVWYTDLLANFCPKGQTVYFHKIIS